MKRSLTIIAVLAATACGTSTPVASPSASEPAPTPTATDTRTITLLTHDSFNLTESLLDDFTASTGIAVEILRAGDAVAMLNQAILTKGEPLGDVVFGIDNVSLATALEADILLPTPGPLPDDVRADLVLDPDLYAVPVDTGDVCLNWDREAFDDLGLAVPETLEDLRDPQYASRLVVENPATSSPGVAFLLSTIAEYGEDGWQAFWQDLRDGGVTITSGWEDAYYGHFSGGSGEGNLPLVVSYATSPPAEVLYGPDPDAEVAPTGTILGTCFRQIEFAGVLNGTQDPDAANAFIEFLLSDAVQEDIPLSMFVFPARDVALPDVFVKHAEVAESPYELDADLVAANREAWVEDWTELMLR